MPESYRKLTKEEIRIMEERGCSSEEWERVLASENGFDPQRFKHTIFHGDIRLGLMEKKFETTSGIIRTSGVYNSVLHNCVIKDNVYIRNVSNYISNYIIESDVIIDDVNTLEVTEDSSFGNGVRASVINEAGGREVPIYDRLSAHEAYVIAFYRHRIKLIDGLRTLIDDYSKKVTSHTGIIGRGSKISNCGNIRNVKVGEYAELYGIVRLNNGTVNSNKTAPTTVGAGVIADDFIMASGCSVTDGVILDKCFIGQATELSKQYSAENSVFFANCGGFHGEACSVFAGPYTVTHHKSTLLIAGFYSFMNAGSASNQSNHLYKLGPVHQGILERGTKTTSNSYILFPARIGAFTLVMGRHTANPDTSDFPFSYLLEDDDESVLVPGVNIKSVGTIRDSKKWPRRDQRIDTDILDNITFHLLTPYTVQKMISGKYLLENLRESSGHSTQKYYHNGVRIARTSLARGIDYYELGITRFVGNALVTLLRFNEYSSIDDLRKLLGSGNPLGKSKWLDLSGMIAPEAALEELYGRIEKGELKELNEVGQGFKQIYENYASYELAWNTEQLEQRYGKPYTELTASDISSFLDDWLDAVETMDNMRCEDARKEFNGTAMVGFGIDGDVTVRKADFIEVRGDENSNTFITELKQRLTLKQGTVRDLKKKLAGL